MRDDGSTTRLRDATSTPDHLKAMVAKLPVPNSHRVRLADKVKAKVSTHVEIPTVKTDKGTRN